MSDEAYAYLGRLRPAVAPRFPALDATRWYRITLHGPGGIAAPANHVWLHAPDRVRAIPVWDLDVQEAGDAWEPTE